MHLLIYIVIILFTTQINAQEWKVKGPSPIKTKFNEQFPKQLIHSDSQYIIISKSDKKLKTREIEIFNHDFKSVRKIKINSTDKERVDHILWTGQHFIFLWEKKVQNKRILSYQIVSMNGRAGSKINLGNINDAWGGYLRQHQVEIIKSPNHSLFAFVVKEVVSKNYQGKNAEYSDLIAVFDQSGKLIEKQQNKYTNYSLLDTYHFISNDSILSKWIGNFDKNEFQISQKHITDKSKNNQKSKFNLPTSSKILNYHIEFNNSTNTFDFFANTKSHDSIRGINGTLFTKINSDSFDINGQWYQPFDTTLLDQFKSSSKFSEGNILYQDYSLSTDFIFRKLMPTADGGWFMIQEYFPKFTPDFLKKNDRITHTHQLNLHYNTDYIYNTPLNMSDAILTYISKDGSIKWQKRIAKPQDGLGHQWGAFDAIIQENDLYFLYNIETKGKSFVKKFDQQHVELSNLFPKVLKISMDGEVKSISAHQTVDQKFVFFPLFTQTVLQQEPAILFLQEKSNTSPSKGRLVKFEIEKQ